MTQSQALQRSQDVDSEAFIRLVDRHQAMLFRTAFLMSGSQSLAGSPGPQELCVRLGTASNPPHWVPPSNRGSCASSCAKSPIGPLVQPRRRSRPITRGSGIFRLPLSPASLILSVTRFGEPSVRSLRLTVML